MRTHGIACPLCGRTVQGSPGDPIPEHLDGTFGTPCLASGWTFRSFLAHHEAVEVPQWLPGMDDESGPVSGELRQRHH